MRPADDLYDAQWHFDLLANGRGRDRANELIWDEYSGAGVTVAVYEGGGFETTHPDLAENYDPALDASEMSAAGHATSVAGLIAAAANGYGVVGVAWGATLGRAAIGADLSGFDISNHSWGYYPHFAWNDDVAQLLAEFEAEAATGRGGLGHVAVQANGNDQVDSNGEAMAASRFTVSVNALSADGVTAWYSSFGANLLVSAGAASVTTDLTGPSGYSAGDYTDAFSGTSAASPVTAGVVALMLEANPGLGWRDVKDILALTAFHTGSGLPGEADHGPGPQEEFAWLFNAARTWNGGGLHYSENYGFGNVDVFGAVRMAEAYALIGAAAKTSANEGSVATAVLEAALAVPDGQPDDAAVFSFVLPGQVEIEQVSLTLGLDHDIVTDLGIVLVSPQGTEIQVYLGHFVDAVIAPGTWTFGIEGLRGELSAGTWTLRVVDLFGDFTGSIETVQLTAYGVPPDEDDVYRFTDEYAAMVALEPDRSDLEDDVGVDWIDAAAVSGDSFIDLSGLQESWIGGGLLQLRSSADIEHAIAGDGTDTLNGNEADNRLYGMRGDDLLIGQRGHDLLFGGAGRDQLFGGVGNDTLEGGAGADTLWGGAGNDLFFVEDLEDLVLEVPGQGMDEVRTWLDGYRLGFGVERLTLLGSEDLAGIGSGGANRIVGNDGANRLLGEGGEDTLLGRVGADSLAGGAGADLLNGGAGADTLVGGAGRDRLVGGLGPDLFVFTADDLYEIQPAALILDFAPGQDRIDLSAIDADVGTALDEAFSFIGSNPFGFIAGELQARITEVGRTIIRGDIDGDGRHDLRIVVEAAVLLTEGDFLL